MAKLLTNSDLSEYLQISRMTLNRWRTLGMPCLLIGKQVRYDLPLVMKWIDENSEVLRGEFNNLK